MGWLERGVVLKVRLSKISGIDDAIVSLMMSHGKYTLASETKIRDLCNRVLDSKGAINIDASTDDLEEYNKYLKRVVSIGWQHITVLRFIDFSFVVDGLHRAGQDDWDSHAKRFDNRIIRLSTREQKLDAKFSDYYRDKVLSDDEAVEVLGIALPETILIDDEVYVKVQNGYVLEEYKNNSDVLRGLYHLGIPSTFIFKVNLTEFAHVYKERNINGRANPEVKELAEKAANLLEAYQPMFTRDLLLKIKN